jgi:parallel beta-helix repeat protein
MIMVVARIILILSLSVTFFCLPSVTFRVWKAGVSSGYPVHNLNTGLNYSTIQGAIDAPETLSGQTIEADAGIYYEHVSVGKSVFLVGESRSTTIIDGSGAGPVLILAANGVIVSDFTVRNGGYAWSPQDTCVWGDGLSGILVENSTVTEASNGIIFHNVQNGWMNGNSAEGCTVMGLHLDSSDNCTMVNNTVIDSFQGIVVEKSTGSFVRRNELVNNNLSMGFYSSTGNLVGENNLINNRIGIGLDSCDGPNSLRNNSMINGGYNLIVWGASPEAFEQDIDTSNVVDGRKIYYVTDSHNLTLNPADCSNIGYLALVNCTNVTVEDIDLSNDKDGMLMAQSADCSLINVTLSNSHANMILISNAGPSIHPICGGLTFFKSDNNSIINGRITNNTVGVCLYESSGNLFYHDAFVDIDEPAISNFQSPVSAPSGSFSINRWDNGLEGNYWSDYAGVDSDHDGIGDTSYVIDSNNTDHFPLEGVFSEFNATSEYRVQIISNSTISDFHFSNSAIVFNVSLEEGFSGFCRVCIPTALMNATYRVFVNGTETHYDLLPCSNLSQSFLYFTYPDSEQEVVITPEFPTVIILAMLMIAVSLPIAVIIRGRVSKS